MCDDEATSALVEIASWQTDTEAKNNYYDGVGGWVRWESSNGS